MGPVLRLALAAVLAAGHAIAAEASLVDGRGPDPGILATPLQAADLAASEDAEWLDGRISPVASLDQGRHRCLWTRTTWTSWQGLAYGTGTAAGVRHLRLSFARDVAVGSVLATGNGSLSILRPGAAGDPGDEAQWLPAERLEGRTVTSAQTAANQLALWIVPAGSSTRGLRFSHRPAAADSDYAGRLGSVYLFAQRYANVAPQGRVAASAGTREAARLGNGCDDGWSAWSNGEGGAEQPVSPERPVDIVLAFPGSVTLRGVGAWACGMAAAELASVPAAGAMPAFVDAGWK